MSDLELVEQWLEYMAGRGLAPSSLQRYRRDLVRLVEFLAQLDPPQSLVTIDRWLLEDYVGPYLHQVGQTPRTRRVVVAAIRGLFRWLWQREILRTNPAQGLEPPKGGLRLPTVASMATAEALLLAPDLSTFKGLRDSAMLCLLVGCGLRLSEVSALNESSLQWEPKPDGGDRLVLKVLGKGSKERLVPAPPEAKAMLRAYLAHPDRRSMDLRLEDGDQPLFVSIGRRDIPAHEYRGEHRRIRGKAIQQAILIYGRQAGLADRELHPHALRHLFGAQMVDQDVDLRTIQTLLGHADIKTTQIYTAVTTARLSRVIDQASPLRRLRIPARELALRLDRLGSNSTSSA